MRKMIAGILLMLLFMQSAFAADLLDGRISTLNSLGLAISDDAAAYVRESIDKIWERIPEEYRELYGGVESYYEYTMILSCLGSGIFNKETMSFEPVTEEIFAFDAEMWSIPEDYFALLEAIVRLSDGEISIEDCDYQVSEEDMMLGEGEMIISFTMNGVPREFEAVLMSDWMDCGILEYINECLQEMAMQNRIWSMFDGGQGFIIFYKDADWVAEFESETCCELSLSPNQAAKMFFW